MNIEAKELSKIYGSGESRVVALDKVNLEIASSDFISIMGPSGSGKSTLFHLLSGLDNGINYLFDESEDRIVHSLPYDPLSDPVLFEESQKSGDGIQFSHTFEEQIGGQLEAGFTLTDVYEDTNGAGNLHDHNIPTFWATRAVKRNS